MVHESPTGELCVTLSRLIRAMVAHPEAITVVPLAAQGGSIVLQVKAAKSDRGKLIGMQGRTSRSLRIILATISATCGQPYTLDIYDEPETL